MESEWNTFDEYDSIYSYSNFQIILWGLTVFYMTGTLVIIIWPLWALMNANASSSILGPVFGFKGLFVQCAQYMSGQYQCDNYLNPVFEQPGTLVMIRTFGVLSMMFACVGTGLCLLGMNCARCSEDNIPTKNKILRGGILLIALSGGCLTFICVWFATIIKREYSWFNNIPEQTVNSDFIRYEYGGCVYAGFILSLLSYILVWLWIQSTLEDREFVSEDSEASSVTTMSENSVITAAEDQRLTQYVKNHAQLMTEERTRAHTKSNSAKSRSHKGSKISGEYDAEASDHESFGHQSDNSRTAFI